MPYPDLNRVLRGEVTGAFSCIELGRQTGQIAATSIHLHFKRHFREWHEIRDLFRRYNVMFTVPMAHILEDQIRGRIRAEDDTLRMHCYVHHSCVADVIEELVETDRRWAPNHSHAMPLGHHDGWVRGDVRGIWCLAPFGGDPNQSHLTIYGVQHIVHQGPIYQFVQCDCDREDTAVIAQMRGHPHQNNAIYDMCGPPYTGLARQYRIRYFPGQLDWAVDGYRRHLSEGDPMDLDQYYIDLQARRAPAYLLP
ncbi:hypothetical protein SISNIDRAFT_468461 [Sistotremastrum niveocremeum HHB9708]|uniref:Uncharacterized protein n=1 Tax=Sistotremastrum niveocremeum HHB9708 TaxID=1314777 RepID=A0A164RMM3_9AGAM|nr:hypothetical protein SISNIDRAFT_468461 [Sistotremastrum niveocremeum HHB9708]